MKVGDYVRNKCGIAKVIDIENNNGIDILVFDKPICFLVNKETGEIKDDRLLNRLAIIDGVDVSKIKSSPNIIDLLKKKDIVIDYKGNMYQVVKVWKDYVFTDKKNKYGQVITLVDYQIKSIVTKECFESMKYEVK